VVSYLQLAHNERHLATGSPIAKVIHSFGRAEQVDRAALARLVSSISRFLTPEEAAAAAHGADVEIVDSRPMGSRWTLNQVWERLGIGAAIRKAASGRRLDAAAVERVVFSGHAARLAAGLQARRDRLGRQAGRGHRLPRLHRRRGLRSDGLPARRARGLSPVT